MEGLIHSKVVYEMMFFLRSTCHEKCILFYFWRSSFYHDLLYGGNMIIMGRRDQQVVLSIQHLHLYQ